MQFLWKYIDDLVGKGLEMPVISELLLYTSASLVPMALPLAVLLASIMTFGNLAEHNELLALKSAGISLQRIMRPLVYLVLLITIMAFGFNNNILPLANLKMRSLLYDIQRQNPELSIKTGMFDNTLAGYSIRIEERDQRTNLLMNIRIYDHTDNMGNIIVTLADSGYMKMTEDERHLVLTLYNGETYTEMQKQRRRTRDNTYPHRRDFFKKQEMIIELVDFGLQRSDEELFKSSFQMMNLKQLGQHQDTLIEEIKNSQGSLNRTLSISSYTRNHNFIRRLRPPNDTTPQEEFDIFMLNKDTLYNELSEQEKERVLSHALNQARTTMNYINNTFITVDNKIRRLRKYEIETQRKFSLSIACIIFFFIGAPLGAIIRKGGLGMPVVVSVVFFLFYYMISLTSEKFVRESVLSAEIGMWISSIILIPLGAFLTYKATTDSVIMNVETYFSFLKRLGKLSKLLKP
jgi:lipopolysaccharide export system permease protein